LTLDLHAQVLKFDSFQGSKLWALFPPELSEEEVGTGINPDDEPSSNWFLRHLPHIAAKYPGKLLLARTLPGSVLHIPPGWHHAVWNLNSMNIAVTQNFVTSRRFELSIADVNPGDDVAAIVESRYGLANRKAAVRWLKAILDQTCTDIDIRKRIDINTL